MANTRELVGWQQLPSGVTVVSRGWLWRVSRVEHGRDVLAVDLEPVSPRAPAISTLLTPFDRIAPRPAPTGWRPASRSRLRQVVASLDGIWPDMPLACALATTSVPWPHQYVPAIALIQGRGGRLLVADEVGLGKTLAAGMAIAELAARNLAARVLVLAPAGLRDQWRAELRRHLGMAAEIIDAPGLATLARDVPAGCSPWVGRGCWIVSFDFAKQPIVLTSLSSDSWDVLVIDEAHAVSGESQRAAAVRALALHARFIVMLTATPHNGAPLSFRKLVALGAHDSRDPLVWIRRGRTELGYAVARPSRAWRLRSSPDETALQRALHAYAARVDAAGRPEARLAMIVLKKRALSSPDALRCSLQRRLAHLSGTIEPVMMTAPLPFEVGETTDDDHLQPVALAAPGLHQAEAEVAVLHDLIELARRAARTSTKFRALDRIVARTTETAVLFTEYRDTLRVVESRLARMTTVAILHGGLDRVARRDAVRRFTTGEARILLATDAAAEGLNLQARCRFVVHIDLPWSPTTLAQRVGRVDRIGQTRPVRVWHLTSAGGHEGTIVAALARRFRCIHDDLGGPVPREWVQVPADVTDRQEIEIDGRVDVADLADTADAIARSGVLIRELRARSHRPLHGGARSMPRGIPWIRSHRALAIVERGVVFLFNALPRSPGEARAHVGIHVSLQRLPQESPSIWLQWLAEHAARRAAAAVPVGDLLRQRARTRERELLARLQAENQRLQGRWQPSLFDQRAGRVIAVARQSAGTRTDAHSRRLAELRRTDEEPIVEPIFALIVG
jgi:superfamily II DNA or RNA helicase